MTTTETTAAYMKAYGISYLSTASLTASTHVFRLDPPIPGVEKTIIIASTVSGALEQIQPERLDHIFPGSWINANFDTRMTLPISSTARCRCCFSSMSS